MVPFHGEGRNLDPQAVPNSARMGHQAFEHALALARHGSANLRIALRLRHDICNRPHLLDRKSVV